MWLVVRSIVVGSEVYSMMIYTYIPGPIPTLIMSAPDNNSSSTISPVTTLPAYQDREGGREVR